MHQITPNNMHAASFFTIDRVTSTARNPKMSNFDPYKGIEHVMNDTLDSLQKRYYILHMAATVPDPMRPVHNPPPESQLSFPCGD
jgi:hypothetical protein